MLESLQDVVAESLQAGSNRRVGRSTWRSGTTGPAQVLHCRQAQLQEHAGHPPADRIQQPADGRGRGAGPEGDQLHLALSASLARAG